MTKEAPSTLREWEDLLFSALKAAQHSDLSDLDRDILHEFLREHIPLVLFAPAPPSQEPEREDAWTDLGYRSERREADHEPECPF